VLKINFYLFCRELIKGNMATGGGPFEEVMHDQDLPNWSNDSVDDRLNNMV
jgi:hypothetical protein